MVSGLRTGIRFMPPRVVLITNYCGGVGKTTLSMALARHFRKAAGLPTALLEVGIGASSFDARLGKHASLYTVITQSQSAEAWEMVDLFPSNSWGSEALANDNRIESALKDIIHAHTLTVFDISAQNPLWKYCIGLATDVLVVGMAHNDAVAQTESMMRALVEDTAPLDPKPKIHLVLNQVKPAGERIQMAGTSNAWVGFDEGKARSYDGSLAEPLLRLLYPGWNQCKKKIKKGAPKEIKA